MSSLFLERSIPQLIEGLTKRQISVEDMALTTTRVVAETEAETLAWVCTDPDALLIAAHEASAKVKARGSPRGLEGIPFGVKDIFNTRAFPTEMGSPIWKGFTPGNNARVVDSLLASGAIVAGKTVTAEFAVHALNETINPHDPAKTPGTSSSGSAAAVARGMVPFALGSQTAASIIRPAGFCGVWGMKPSFGMIPRTGVLKTTDSLDTIGFLASHGRSLRPILDSARVRGPDYPLVYRNVDRRGGFPKPSSRPWSVGFVRTHTWEDAADYVKSSIEELAGTLGAESGFELKELEWPAAFASAHDTHYTIYTKSLSYYFEQEGKLSSHMSSIMSAMISEGVSITTDDFKRALRRQEAFCRELDAFLTPYDFVLSLGTSTSAPTRGDGEVPDPSLVWTLGHVPAVAAPLFRDPHGLPFGAQFVSRRWNDYILLQGVEELVDRGIISGGSLEVRTRAADSLPVAS